MSTVKIRFLWFTFLLTLQCAFVEIQGSYETLNTQAPVDAGDVIKSDFDTAPPWMPRPLIPEISTSDHSNANATNESKKAPVDAEARGRRDVIEEERFHDIREIKSDFHPVLSWLPHPLISEQSTSEASIANATNELKTSLSSYHTMYSRGPAEPGVPDARTQTLGRGARASNENWIKLPYPTRDDEDQDILIPPQPSGDLINSRMPRVNFVTQNKQLDTSESRNDKESIRPSRDDLRTDFVRPDEDDRARQFKPVYPRQALYYPEEPRRYFDNRYYPRDELYARRDPYVDPYERRRPKVYPLSPISPGYGPRVDRFDEPYANHVPRKPKRIIYYANLPEVVRAPPSVDLRYRYSMDPYRRFDDNDYYARTGRYDYRFRNRPYPYPPYAPLRKEERNYRDLAGAGSAVKDNKVDEKVTPMPVIPKSEDGYKQSDNDNRNLNRNLINSHQYHDNLKNTFNDPKSFQDVVRPSDTYLKYNGPLFQSAIVDEPYQRKY